jgi:hypothetical protein
MADRPGRIAASLDSVHESLRMVQREFSGVEEDRARWRWAATGLVIALQGALVTALSGYETATNEDVEDPSNPERFAPVALLLRRARSTEYLNAPERVEITGSSVHQIEHLLSYRNMVVHGLRVSEGEGVAKGCKKVLGILQHVLLSHPAFDVSRHHLVCTLISDEISRIERLLREHG